MKDVIKKSGLEIPTLDIVTCVALEKSIIAIKHDFVIHFAVDSEIKVF